MTNGATYKTNFARILSSAPDRVELAFDLDAKLWPWLNLPPHHPVLVEKYQYFGATTASWEQGLFTPETFTALTSFGWGCTPAAFAGDYPTRGVFKTQNGEEAMGFSLNVGADDGQVMYQTRGQGFAFKDRDYRVWRERSRRAALDAKVTADFQFLSPEAVGLAANGHSFIGVSEQADQALTLIACVTKQGGYVPEHPFHTGSRDHVNAAQLMDCGLQAAHWFLGGGQSWAEPLICIGGEARFQRYVELDVPFTITLVEQVPNTSVQLKFSQAGYDNAVLVLKWGHNVAAKRTEK